MEDGALTLDSGEIGAELERRFDALVCSHRDRALRLAWRLVGGDAAAAEDVTQDAFVRAYQGLGRFRGDAALETWFYRILVRQAYSYRRWRAIRTLWNGAEWLDAPDPKAEEPGDPGLRRRIGAALESLSRSQRDVFVLIYLEGFRVRECAEILGKPIGTVKSHLHRALASLRSDLGDLREPEGSAREEE